MTQWADSFPTPWFPLVSYLSRGSENKAAAGGLTRSSLVQKTSSYIGDAHPAASDQICSRCKNRGPLELSKQFIML